MKKNPLGNMRSQGKMPMPHLPTGELLPPTRTTFQDLAQRLRNYFGVSGNIEVVPDYKFVMAFNAGDLMEAGNSAGKGRLFAASFSGAPGVGQQYSFRSRVDCVLTSIHVSLAVGVPTAVGVNYFAPGATDITGGYVSSGIWMERLVTAPGVDLPHMQIGSSILDGSNAPIRAFFSATPEVTSPLASQFQALPNGGKLHLPANAGINVQVTAGHTITVNLLGRIL